MGSRFNCGKASRRDIRQVSKTSSTHFLLIIPQTKEGRDKNTNLTNSEDVEKLLDVVVVLDGSGKLFPPQGRRQAGRHQFRDLLSNTELEIHREKAELGIWEISNLTEVIGLRENLKSGKFGCGKFNWRSCL